MQFIFSSFLPAPRTPLQPTPQAAPNAAPASTPALRADATRLLAAWLSGVMPLIVVLAWSALLALAPAAAAADTPGKPSLEASRAEMAGIQKSIAKAKDDAELTRLRAAALAAMAESESTAADLTPQLDSVTARLQQLGTPPQGVKEAPDIAVQRTQLERARTELDAQIKLARLLSVEAEQTAAQIAERRREQFQALLGERTASILGPRFWAELRDDLPRDALSLAALGRQLMAVMAAASPWTYLLAAGLIASFVVLRIYLGKKLMELTAARLPPTRLRRSLHAIMVLVLTLTTVTLCAAALGLLLGERTAPVAGVASAAAAAGSTGAASVANAAAKAAFDLSSLPLVVFGALCFGGYVAGLGQALLSPHRPSWRLPNMPDSVAHGLRWFPLQLAVLLTLVWIAEGLARLLNASLSTAVAINCITALAIGTSLALAIMRAEQLHREVRRAAPDAAGANRPWWVRALVVIGWMTLAFSLLGILAGYVALGSFVVKQVLWTLVVLGTAYLLSVVVDDGFKAALAFNQTSPASDAATPAADLPTASPSTSAAAKAPHEYRIGEQAAVLLSGVVRVVIALLALMLLLAPFGEGPAELFRRTGELQQGLQIGQINIMPATVIQALLVLGLAVFLVKLLQGWLQNSYLPTTRLDPGMRASASNLLGYLGYVFAISLAMSAAGVGLDRVAWVASALSVGIGFGLQAVVQNFVSGLILLAERPVKVGDWVSLSGVEGDIRSINMRATEIQLGDRSTVIVPNSEFITKIVRNVTHADPLGLVQLKLPLPLTAGPERVRQLLLKVFEDNPSVLATPAPSVNLDGVDNGNLLFNATGFVVSPRDAYGVRSALLFEALKQLSAAGIDMYKPPTVVAMPGSGAAVPAPAVQAQPPLAEAASKAMPAAPTGLAPGQAPGR